MRNYGMPAVAAPRRRWAVAATRETASTAALAVPILLVLTAVLPSALQIVVSKVLITPNRVLCIACFFMVLPSIISAKGFKRSAADGFVIAFALWASLCYLINNGTNGIQSAGAVILESIVPYFVGRVYITDAARLTKIAATMMLIVWVLLPLAIPEAILRIHFVQVALGAKLGNLQGDEGVRYGILRAMATFDHPILYGVYSASILPFAWYVLPRAARVFNIGAIALSVVLSASSAAYLGFVLVVGLIGWETFTRTVQHRWRILALLGFGMLMTVDIISKRPLTSIIAGSLSFSSGTGWTRLLQWDFGWANVMQNWDFGLGSRDWVRPFWLPSSVDNYWLLNAIQFGIPGLGLVILTAAAAFTTVGRNRIPLADTRMHNAQIAWVLMIVMLCVVGLSVDYWKGMQALFFFMIGQGMFLGGLPPAASRMGARATHPA